MPSCTERVSTTGARAMLAQPTGGKDRIADGMGAHFGEIKATHLRKRTDVLATGHASKVVGIGRRIGHFIQRAIAGHQAQAETEGAFGLLSRHRTADVLEQVAHHRRVQLPAPGDQGGGRRQSQTGVWPEPAHPSRQLRQHGGQVETTKQGKRDDVIDHDQMVQAAFALFPGMTARQQFDFPVHVDTLAQAPQSAEHA